MEAQGWPAVRIDGATSVTARQHIVEAFNTNKNIFIAYVMFFYAHSNLCGSLSLCFIILHIWLLTRLRTSLLTTRTGGVGVHLIGADRVILFDPDWNPSTDMQARERAWRLGQTRHVTIYRLICRGTIEEKIYHRQIFKQLLSNKVICLRYRIVFVFL